MKKRLKLFFSIFTSCFAIFALCFGVYASIKVTYNVGGNIHYEIDNAYVDIETRVYSSNKLLSYADGAQIAINFQDVNLSDLSSMASSNGLTLKSTHKQTSLGEQFNSSLSTSLQDITYSSTNGYAYFVVVNIKNKTPEMVSAIISDNITLPQNSWVFHTGYLTGFDNSTTNNNMIIAFGLDDAGIEIASTSFNFQIDIDLGELKPTTTKYTIDETAKTLKINSNATGVVVIGKGNSTATNLQLSSQSKNISHVYCLEDCGINSVGEKAFSVCKRLTEITIPDGVTSIGEHAFINCTGLTEITIPESVNSIGERAFNGCSGLTEITIPESVQSIGNNVFSGCSNLNNVTIDSLSIANGISSNTSQGNLIYNVKSGGTVKVKCSNLSEITSTYLKGSEFIQPTSVVDGYATFIKI